ncbi:MAG: HPr family phosphocarrier protein [Clostridia bacterium]|nr:HPr family phosphocarrier protein [Clostridia bacterium]
MKDITVIVKNQIGLHAHPATYFIQAANAFKSQIWIEKGEKRSNAKSLLGVLSLGIIGGDTLKIIANGDDESTAIETLAKFIDSGFENPDEIESWLSELPTS